MKAPAARIAAAREVRSVPVSIEGIVVELVFLTLHGMGRAKYGSRWDSQTYLPVWVSELALAIDSVNANSIMDCKVSTVSERRIKRHNEVSLDGDGKSTHSARNLFQYEWKDDGIFLSNAYTLK